MTWRKNAPARRLCLDCWRFSRYEKSIMTDRVEHERVDRGEEVDKTHTDAQMMEDRENMSVRRSSNELVSLLINN
jgi:hypothetical protein